MSEQKISSIGWKFWFQWVLANIVGWSIGIVVGVIVTYYSSRVTIFIGDIILSSVGWITYGLVIGLLVGGMQWLVLRQYIPQTSRWVLAIALGWAIGGAVGGAGAAVFGVTGGVVGFIVSGIIQWFILRHQISWAGRWVLTNMLGVLVGLWVSGLIITTTDSFVDGSLRDAAVGTLIGAGYGTVTGILLVWLLRQPRSEAQSVAADTHHSPGGD